MADRLNADTPNSAPPSKHEIRRLQNPPPIQEKP
jgi:hypothetical protein